MREPTTIDAALLIDDLARTLAERRRLDELRPADAAEEREIRERFTRLDRRLDGIELMLSVTPPRTVHEALVALALAKSEAESAASWITAEKGKPQAERAIDLIGSVLALLARDRAENAPLDLVLEFYAGVMLRRAEAEIAAA